MINLYLVCEEIVFANFECFRTEELMNILNALNRMGIKSLNVMPDIIHEFSRRAETMTDAQILGFHVIMIRMQNNYKKYLKLINGDEFVDKKKEMIRPLNNIFRRAIKLDLGFDDLILTGGMFYNMGIEMDSDLKKVLFNKLLRRKIEEVEECITIKKVSLFCIFNSICKSLRVNNSKMIRFNETIIKYILMDFETTEYLNKLRFQRTIANSYSISCFESNYLVEYFIYIFDDLSQCFEKNMAKLSSSQTKYLQLQSNFENTKSSHASLIKLKTMTNSLNAQDETIKKNMLFIDYLFNFIKIFINLSYSNKINLEEEKKTEILFEIKNQLNKILDRQFEIYTEKNNDKIKLLHSNNLNLILQFFYIFFPEDVKSIETASIIFRSKCLEMNISSEMICLAYVLFPENFKRKKLLNDEQLLSKLKNSSIILNSNHSSTKWKVIKTLTETGIVFNVNYTYDFMAFGVFIPNYKGRQIALDFHTNSEMIHSDYQKNAFMRLKEKATEKYSIEVKSNNL
jgi:hypothetical protein